jgi:histidyl-tRNA synthetase
VTLQLNTLGDAESRESWRMALVDHFREHRDVLSEDSQERLEKNPLRILDSKDPRDKALVHEAPRIDDFLSGEAERFFVAVTDGLDAAGVKWERAPTLVRGLDYYRHTAFEFVTDRLGAQGTVLGGGRYDGLIENLGGPHTPAVGWAAGIERLAMLVAESSADATHVAVIVRAGAEAPGLYVASCLRRGGLSTELLQRGKERVRFERARAQGIQTIVVVDSAKPEGPDDIWLQYRFLDLPLTEAIKKQQILDSLLRERLQFSSNVQGTEFPANWRPE